MNLTDPLTVVGIVLAGGAGSIARLVIGGVLQRGPSVVFPIGTFVINVTGAFLLGLLAGAAGVSLGASAMAVIGIGFLGGYTTFSTASVESADLLQKRQTSTAVLYSLGTGVCAMTAALVGISI